MKRGTAAKVILGKDTLMDVPAGIVHGTDVILGGKAGLLNDFGGLVLSNNLMIGKKVSRGTIATITVRGQSPLVLPDAISGSLQAVKAFGGTEQNGTPTPDAPVDIVSNNGAIKFSLNELNPSEIVIGYYRTSSTGALTESPYNFITGYMPVKPGQSYVFFGRIQDDDRLSSYNRIHWFDANKDYISTNTYTKDNVGTGVAPSNAYFAQCSCNESGATSRVTTQEIVDGYNWVFQQGAAEVPYVPYVDGGIYTDGTVETINAHGKNLWNAQNIITLSGYSTPFILNLPVDTYTFSATTTLVEGNEPSSLLIGNKKASWNGSGNRISVTFTNSALTSLRIYSGNSAVDAATRTVMFSDIQLEKGSTATEYEPYYDGGTATAEMLLKVGDYQDQQEILSGAITRSVGIKVLDGTENFETATATNCYSLTNTLGTGNFSNRTIACSHFASTPTLPSTSARQGLAFIANKGPEYTIAFGAKTQFSTQALWKQWLADQYAAGTPVIIIYPLATPTTESVTGQPLQVKAGDNYLEITQASLNNLELEATYKSLVQLTIEEVEDANLNNNVEVTIS